MTDTFENVYVWQKAHQFVLAVYRIMPRFPDFEKFGLCSQFRRAAVSIAANFAEGYKRLSQADKLHFYNISQGSLEECRYYCILSRDLSYIDSQTYEGIRSLLNETSYLLNSYVNGLMQNKFRDSMD